MKTKFVMVGYGWRADFFTALCLPRAIVKDYLHVLMGKDFPVLCETPSAEDIDELNALWELKEKYMGRVQVAEQYYVKPLYAAWLKVIEDSFLDFSGEQ